jgi:hypothetical protein
MNRPLAWILSMRLGAAPLVTGGIQATIRPPCCACPRTETLPPLTQPLPRARPSRAAAAAQHHGEGEPALEGVVDAQREAHLLPRLRQHSHEEERAWRVVHHGRRLPAALVDTLAPFPVLLLIRCACQYAV